MEPSKINNFFNKLLKERFRITFFHDDFKPVFSLRFTIFTLILWLIGYAVFILMVAIFVIAKTPLREYVMGHESTKERKQIIELFNKIDSLETALVNKNIYIQGILNAFREEKDSIHSKKPDKVYVQNNQLSTKASKTELTVREEIEKEWSENMNIRMRSSRDINTIQQVNFLPPTIGVVISKYDPFIGHNGIDIATKNDEPVMSIDKGIVISAGYSITDGNFLIIMHPNGFVSVYKHLSVVLKEIGAMVSAGDIIGHSGNTGTESHGTHLHFELWYKDKALNPADYILL